MDIYLTTKNNTLQLPVLPERFEASYPSQNTVVNINKLGDVNLIGKTGLCEMTLESFFPAQDYPFAAFAHAAQPYDYVKILLDAQQNGETLRVIITQTPVNILMAIENFTYFESDATRDVYYSLALKAFRPISLQVGRTVTTPSGAAMAVPPTKRDTPEIPGEYLVVSGDTLWAIAKKLTGNGANYTKIAETNGIKDPNMIFPGQKLII